MKFPLSSADDFCAQIKLVTEVAKTRLFEIPRLASIVSQGGNEMTDADLTDAFLALVLVAAHRKIDLGEAVLKVLA
jgi:hypothetical protein